VRVRADSWNANLFLKIVLVVAVLAVFLAIDRWIVQRHGDMRNSDFFSLWASGRGLLEGIDHYDEDAWADIHVRYDSDWLENPVFIYPLLTAFFFLPYALLPLPLAAVAWELTSQAMLVASIVALFAGLRSRRLPIALSLPLLLLSRPAMVIFTNGQLSAVWPFALSLFYLLACRQQYVAACASLVFFLLKPTVAMLILPAALVWLLARRAWKGLLTFAVISGAILGLSLLVAPGWVGRWMAHALAKGTHFATFIPTAWGLSYDLLAGRVPESVQLAALVVVAVGLGGFGVWWLARTSDPWPPALLLAWAVCLSLFLSPYVWNYDQVLLLFPLGVIATMADRMERGQRLLTWAGIVGVMLVLPYVLLVIAGRRGVDTLSSLIPVAALALLVVAAHWGGYCRERTSLKHMLHPEGRFL